MESCAVNQTQRSFTWLDAQTNPGAEIGIFRSLLKLKLKGVPKQLPIIHCWWMNNTILSQVLN
jgi:hypothetical protein